MFKKLLFTDSPKALVLVRLMVGGVFFTEGIQKFLFPDALGVGRFIKIGIIYPEFFAPFVGVVEIVFGLILILGILTRISSFPLLINISVAIITTKIPMLLSNGFWHAMHEARVDLCMFLGCIFFLILGGGKMSIDYYIISKSNNKDKK